MYNGLFSYSFIKSKCQCSCCAPKAKFASGANAFPFLLTLFFLSSQSQHAIDLYKLSHKLLFSSHCGLPQDRPLQGSKHSPSCTSLGVSVTSRQRQRKAQGHCQGVHQQGKNAFFLLYQREGQRAISVLCLSLRGTSDFDSYLIPCLVGKPLGARPG